jgi:hypothetical protein
MGNGEFEQEVREVTERTELGISFKVMEIERG